MSEPIKAPKASRPYMPGYGIPKSKKGMLTWDWVDEQMRQTQIYWVSTVSPDCLPHAVPTWGIWVANKLYFGGGDQTRHMRHLKSNPNMVAHLESGTQVVIIEGVVESIVFPHPDAVLARQLEAESIRKYGAYGEGEGANFALQPHKVLAWKEMLSDATRFIFE